MSIRAQKWALAAGLKGHPQVVLLVLSFHHNPNGEQCNPSLKTIAREAGIGLSSVKRALGYLSDCGLVHVEAQFVDGGRTSSQFWLRVGAAAKPVAKRPKKQATPEPTVGSPPQPNYYAPPEPTVGSPPSAHRGPQKGGDTTSGENPSQECENQRLRVIAGGRHV